MERIKVLVAKPGLDGHDRGAKIIAKYLRDSGMEVIYTGLRQTPATIVATAIQEDVDIIGLSVLSGAHLDLCRKLFDLFRERHMEPPPVVVGGIIPPEDVDELKGMGVRAVFLPGTPLAGIRSEVEALARTTKEGRY